MGTNEFRIRRLSAEEASFRYKPEDIRPLRGRRKTGIIGQPKALKALELGMSVQGPGYNIYVSGDDGTGRLSAVREVAASLSSASSAEVFDYVALHNFIKPDEPVVLSFPRKSGSALSLFELMNRVSGSVKAGERDKALETIASAADSYDEKVAVYLKNASVSIRDGETNPRLFLVNILTGGSSEDTSENAARPLVVEKHPGLNTLFGSAEKSAERGDAPYLEVRAGSILEASGGFLVIDAEALLSAPDSWQSLKRVLSSETLSIHSADNSIRTRPIAISTKVILIGSEETYDKLCAKDEEFLKLFKISAEFDFSMSASEENIAGTIAFLEEEARKNSLLPLSDSALASLLTFSAWFAEMRSELTTSLSVVRDLLFEADFWAKKAGEKEITGEIVEKAKRERSFVSSVSESRINAEILNGEMMIALTGSKTGVVNGLAVMDRGPSSFGTPTVISATVAPGTEGIVNIEHEAGLSGEIHDKGLLILEGYLRKRYARNFPLSIYAGICFEQSYGEVDGDSASSSELFALLSAIGEIPFRQDIAVTGSVNQMGEIQPVGGINEKIEGFWKVCSLKGLTGSQGVIIPKQNIASLILPDEVIGSMREGKFHLYPIETIDEGVQILTGRPAGVRNQKGQFPPESANREIEERLKKLSELSRPSQ